MKSKLKILLVGSFWEKEEIINTLNSMTDIEVIGHIDSGEEAINSHSTYHADIILLHVLTTGITGFETARWIKEQDQNAKIILSSTYFNKDFLAIAFESNLDGYFPTVANNRSFEQSITAVGAGCQYFYNSNYDPIILTRIPEIF